MFPSQTATPTRKKEMKARLHLTLDEPKDGREPLTPDLGRAALKMLTPMRPDIFLRASLVRTGAHAAKNSI